MTRAEAQRKVTHAMASKPILEKLAVTSASCNAAAIAIRTPPQQASRIIPEYGFPSLVRRTTSHNQKEK
jgi:hypothetical protein